MIFQNNVSMISIQSLYCVGGYVAYEVLSSTCGFSGKCNFCIEQGKFKEYLQIIDFMIKSLEGEIDIRDAESDAYIRFWFENSLSFYVSGQLGGSHEDNMLKFKFRADQTVLYGLKEKLLDF